MGLIVRTDSPYFRPDTIVQRNSSLHDSDDFDALGDEVRNDRVEEEGDGGGGLTTESGYLRPVGFTPAGDSPDAEGDPAPEADEAGLPEWDREAGQQRITEIVGQTGRWDDLAQQDQDEIRGIVSIDLLEGAREGAFADEGLTSVLASRKQTLMDGLPGIEGLEQVVNNAHDDVIEGVEDILTPAMREAIDQGLADPDNPAAWTAFRIEATRQIDSAVRQEAGIEPDPETGVQAKSEEQVVRDYTGLLLGLAPQGEAQQPLAAQMDEVAHRILVERPVDAIRQGDGDVFEGLERETQTDRTGQPMSSLRVAQIIEASEDDLRAALSGANGNWREAADSLNLVATRANAEPGGEEALNLLAGMLVDEGLMDSSRENGSVSGTSFYDQVMASVEDGYGVDLSLHVAAEFVRQGNDDRAEIVLQEARSRSRAFFGSVGETAEEFETTFKDDPQFVNANFQGFLSPEQQAGAVDNLQSELRERNADLIERFQHNRNGIVSTLSALEHMPEALQGLDGAGRFTRFHDDSIATLESDRSLADENAEAYREGLQGAVFGREFSMDDVSSVSTDTRQSLSEMSDAFYSDLISGFDQAQDEPIPESEGGIPVPAELTELRAALGNDPDMAASALKDNPDAAFAFAQYMYMADSPTPPEGREVPGHSSPGFLTRTTKDLLVDIIEKESPYLKNAFSGNGAMPVRPEFQANPQTERMVRQQRMTYLGAAIDWRRQQLANGPQRGLMNMARNWWYSPDRFLTPPATRVVDGQTVRIRPGEEGYRPREHRVTGDGIYQHKWVGPPLHILSAGLYAWGTADFWPDDWGQMNPLSSEFDIDAFSTGMWGPYFAALTVNSGAHGAAGVTRWGAELLNRSAPPGRPPSYPGWTNFTAQNGTIGRTLVTKSINWATAPMMGWLVANELRKGDYAMAAAWTPAFGASLMALSPTLMATSWAGPVALGLWAVSAAAALGISQYRSVEASNHYEDPMKWYLEGAGFSEERAHEMGNATGDGEIRYPLLGAISDELYGIDRRSLFEAFNNDAMPEDDLGALVELTHYLDVELDEEGNLPPDADISESDRYILSLIYRLLPAEYKDGVPEIFGGELPPAWETSLSREQPSRVQQIAYDLYWGER